MGCHLTFPFASFFISIRFSSSIRDNRPNERSKREISLRRSNGKSLFSNSVLEKTPSLIIVQRSPLRSMNSRKQNRFFAVFFLSISRNLTRNVIPRTLKNKVFVYFIQHDLFLRVKKRPSSLTGTFAVFVAIQLGHDDYSVSN